MDSNSMNVIVIEPDLNADIIPAKRAAGIDLGLNVNEFLERSNHIFMDQKAYHSTFKDDFDSNNKWVVYRDSGFDVYGKGYKVFRAKWNNDIILRFDGDSKKTLDYMILQGDYKGKLWGRWVLGTSLKELSKEFKIIFYADTHYIKRKDSEENEYAFPIQIHTDYLLSFEEQPDQIIKAISIYLPNIPHSQLFFLNP